MTYKALHGQALLISSLPCFIFFTPKVLNWLKCWIISISFLISPRSPPTTTTMYLGISADPMICCRSWELDLRTSEFGANATEFGANAWMTMQFTLQYKGILVTLGTSIARLQWNLVMGPNHFEILWLQGLQRHNQSSHGPEETFQCFPQSCISSLLTGSSLLLLFGRHLFPPWLSQRKRSGFA